MAILLEIPGLPTDKRQDIREELKRFVRALKKRARKATELRDYACANPARSSEPDTLEELVEEVDDEEEQ